MKISKNDFYTYGFKSNDEESYLSVLLLNNKDKIDQVLLKRILLVGLTRLDTDTLKDITQHLLDNTGGNNG